MRDLTILCAVLLSMAASAFVSGFSFAVYAVHTKDAADMVALRAQVEPQLTKLFARAGTP